MRKRTCKGFLFLWISLITLFFAQTLLISANALQTDVEIVKTNDIESSNKCLEVKVKIPILESENLKHTSNEIDMWTKGWINDTKVVINEYKKTGYICNYPFQLYAEYSVTENKKDVLSFFIDYYQFTGGAHGITTKRAYTLDRKTGYSLTLDKLFKKGYDYKKVINSEIKSQISKDKEKYFDSGALFKGVDENTKFYLNGENLVIYYGSYEIAPYASGLPEFNIPLKMFNTNYLYYNK